MNQPLPNLNISMIRDNLDDLPVFELSAGYTIARYQPGDETFWVDIHRKADKYNEFDEATFHREFGNDELIFQSRQFYLIDNDRCKVGTSTAWFDSNYHGQEYGLVHWVAIMPASQGKGLAKPLLSITCQRLKELGHSRVYLTTSTVRIPAINLYLKFGFAPEIRSDTDAECWELIRGRLKYVL